MRNRVVEEWDQVKDVEVGPKSQQRTHKRLLLQCITSLCVRRDVGGLPHVAVLLGGFLETKHVWLLLWIVGFKKKK